MIKLNCPCKKRNCPRHGKCDECRKYHAKSKRKRPVACERAKGEGACKDLLLISICLAFFQCLFLLSKQIVFSYTAETLFSRSMLTMILMIILFAVMLFYCRHRGFHLSLFPKKFSLFYIAATSLAVIFYIFTLFFVKSFSWQNALMLFYASLVTPIFEEALFRGAIWNRLEKHFSKEWKTYLVVTLLFALWHIGYAVGIYLWNGGNLLSCIAMKVALGVLFGLITGAIRLKTKNCYLGIIIHGLLNVLG